MSDFEIGGRHFKLRKLNAFKQFHIVRRVGPILSGLVPVATNKMKDIGKMSENDKLEFLGKFATPILEGLSKLSNEDAEYVLFGLLEAAEVQQPSGNWAKVSTGTMIMMQDLELPVLMQIAGRALMFNLSGFFAALPQ